MRIAIFCAIALAAAVSWPAEGSPPSPNRPPDDPVFRQEVGTWTTTFTLWPQGIVGGIVGPVKSYPGTQTNVLNAERSSLARTYESKELLDHITGPELGKEFREDAFKWGTGHGATLRYDRKSGKYLWEWSGKDVVKRIGWMEGTYDPKNKTLTMKYINPYKPSVDNSSITHSTQYIDADRKKTVVSIPAPENKGGPLPTSFIMFEIVAKRKRD